MRNTIICKTCDCHYKQTSVYYFDEEYGVGIYTCPMCGHIIEVRMENEILKNIW